MSYREIPQDRILVFAATPAFKGWRQYFTKNSALHPAKMNLNLLRWILHKYTETGNTVLDPMAGTGSTAILASLLGRHGVAVEYEPQFCKMINENISRSGPQDSLMTKGSAICLQGDARELSKLLGESDTIIISPPYGEAQSGGGIATKGYDGPKHSPTDLIGKRSYMPDRFEKENNIAVLKYGDFDTVIISPPYEATCLDGRDVERRIERLKEAGHDPRDFIGGQARVVTLKNYDKVDIVVTSPPYGNRLSDEAVQDGDEARISYRQAMDSIVTSPPYEESETETGGDKGKRGGDSKLRAKKDYIEVSEDNIGNLKSESYLQAMLTVYRECHKVLKPEGVMVLVTKNFIRDKQVIRLDLDTIKLCGAAGFRLSDHWYFKLPTRSFWRILYRRKYPDVPEVEYEDVLVFEKKIRDHDHFLG